MNKGYIELDIKKHIPKVTILMSTYNGEKFIRQQLESLFAQEDVEIYIDIRDDGSTDRTIDIIKSYNDERVRICRGKNLKPAQSFLSLLRNCKKADYYAYCDQDDVWNSKKLITAVQMIGTEDYTPTLYMSTYELVDEKLNYIYTFDMEFEKPLRLEDTITHRAPSACTMVFNDSLRNILIQSKPKFIRMHDFWTLMVTEAFHYRIVTDNSPQLKYRQHSSNSVSVTPSVQTRIKRLFKSALQGDHERWKQAKELYDAYGNEMPDDSRDILETVINYRKSLQSRMHLVQDKRFISGNMYYDILFKISVLLGLF